MSFFWHIIISCKSEKQFTVSQFQYDNDSEACCRKLNNSQLNAPFVGILFLSDMKAGADRCVAASWKYEDVDKKLKKTLQIKTPLKSLVIAAELR